MACQINADRVSKIAGRVSVGLSQMSSKQAFFTGLGVGASGTGLGAVLLANRQRLARLFRRSGRPRQAVALTGTVRPVNGAARTGQKPKPIPALAAGRATSSKPKPVPVLATAPTTLQAASIQIQTGSGEPFLAEDSYRVVRADGSDTGLAITPYLESGQANGKPAVKADAWGVTHAGSGALVAGPYESVDQAQELATKLSNLPWTGTMSKQDVGRAKRIIQAYRTSRTADREL